MSVSEQYQDPLGKRKYLRLNIKISVEFTVLRVNRELVGLDWQTGHTCNVSSGGLCLETELLNSATIKHLVDQQNYLELRVHLPDGGSKPIRVIGALMWHKPMMGKHYMIGLEFRTIANEDLQALLQMARKHSVK
jgi:PilZ domain